MQDRNNNISAEGTVRQPRNANFDFFYGSKQDDGITKNYIQGDLFIIIFL